MNSVTDLFDKLEGASRVARLIGVKQSAASEMKRRGSIPVRYWPQLVEACQEQGLRDVTYDTLVSLHSKGAAA